MNNILAQIDYFKKLINSQKLLFTVVALLTMSIVTAVNYLIPAKYEASTTIFIEQNIITDLVKGIAITSSMQSKIKNLTGSLTSRSLLLDVVKTLDKDLAFSSDADQENYIKSIQKRITISLNEKQGLLVLTFRDHDPKFARDFANALARTYIEQNTSSKRLESIEATSFLANQIETFKKRLESADATINAFKSEKGLILSSDETYLRGEIRAAEHKLEELSIRRADLEAKLAILTTPKAPGKKGDSRSEAELKRLRSIYTDKHPKVQKALQAAQASRSKGESGPDSISEKDEIQLLKAEINTLKTLEERQVKIIEENKILFQEMPHVKSALAELINKKEEESRIYDQLVTRYGQSEISKQMELSDKSVTFRVIDPALLPEIPVSPNRVAIIIMGIFLGIATGIGVVILVDRFSPTLRSPLDIKNFDTHVLAVIPLIVSEHEKQALRHKDRLVIIAGTAYFALILGVLFLESIRALHASAWLTKLTG